MPTIVGRMMATTTPIWMLVQAGPFQAGSSKKERYHCREKPDGGSSRDAPAQR